MGDMMTFMVWTPLTLRAGCSEDREELSPPEWEEEEEEEEADCTLCRSLVSVLGRWVVGERPWVLVLGRVSVSHSGVVEETEALSSCSKVPLQDPRLMRERERRKKERKKAITICRVKQTNKHKQQHQ